MNKIRWGLLSTANINRRLIPAIRASALGQLSAVASRDLITAQAYAVKWEIPHAFGSYQAMLKSGLIDAVYIGLPNHLHAEWSIRALHSGVHVLCEKPLATSLDEVDRMIAASRQTGRVLAEAFMYRHHPQTKIIGDLVHNGRLGEIRLVHAAFHFLLTNPENVRLVPEYGGGSLWDVGVYPLSLAQFIFGGPPESVFGSQQLGLSGVDLTFVGQMTYPGGGMALFSSSFSTPFFTFAEITGSKGRIQVPRPFTGVDPKHPAHHYPGDDEMIEIPVPDQDLYLGEVEDIHTAILDGKAPYLSLQETRNHIQTVLALYQSARTEKPVDINEIH